MSRIVDFATLRKKLLDHQKEFNGFKNINDKNLDYINNKIKEFNELSKKTRFIYAINPQNKKYAEALSIIVDDRNMTYDEKIYFLIKVLDPELKMHSLSLEFGTVTTKEINEEESEYSKNELLEVRNQQQSEMQTYIRNQIGFYDSNLHLYEKYYIVRFCRDEELVFNVKKDYIKNLLSIFFSTEGNLEIPVEDLERIIKLAKEYVDTYGIPNINDLAYQLTIQFKVLGISKLKEKIIFLIYVVDKKFKAYEIYDTECTWEQIKKSCINELGFYEKDFVNAEILYDQTFNKEKSISSWQ